MSSNSEVSRIARLGLAAIIVATFGLSGRIWAAVTIESKVTDTEAGAAFTTTPATGGTITTTATSKDHKITGNPTFNVTTTASGATSYGYAAVSDAISGSIATKTVAPSVVVKPGFPVGKTTAYSDPIGPVTMQVHPSSGAPNQLVNMQFFFPGAASADVDHSIDDSTGRSSQQLNSSASPSQGIVIDTGGLSTAQLNGLLDVAYHVNVQVSQASTGLDATIFFGNILFTNGTVSFTDNFTQSGSTVGFNESISGTDHIFTITGLGSVAKAFQVQANSDFDVDMDVSMTVGNENGPDFTNGALLTRPTGVLGLFTAALAPIDRDNFSLTATPEPSTFVLAALAGLGATAYRWRRRNAPH